MFTDYGPNSCCAACSRSVHVRAQEVGQQERGQETKGDTEQGKAYSPIWMTLTWVAVMLGRCPVSAVLVLVLG